MKCPTRVNIKERKSDNDSKKINSDKNLKANEGGMEMDKDKIINGEEQEMISSNGSVNMEQHEIQQDEVSNEIAEEDTAKAVECIADAVPFSAKNAVRSSGASGIFTLVKAKTGNRVVLSSEVSNYLKKPSKLQFSYSHDSLIMGSKLPNNNSNFNVKDYKNKAIVYSVPLVREIAKKFELDFDDKTSMIFGEAEYTQF
ncbi:amidophosphoribosyltransferase [Clostridium butyricum]